MKEESFLCVMTFSSKKQPICSYLFNSFFDQGKFLAAQRFCCYGFTPFCFGKFPGGKVEKGESEKTCILREIKEERELKLEVFERVRNLSMLSEEKNQSDWSPFLVVGKSENHLLEHAQISWVWQIPISNYLRLGACESSYMFEYLERNWEEYQKKIA